MYRLEPLQQAGETRNLPDWVEQGILLEPRKARKAGVSRALEPLQALVGVAELRERRSQAEGRVMIRIRTAHDRGDSCPCLRLHSDRGFDGRERSLRPDIRTTASLDRPQ